MINNVLHKTKHFNIIFFGSESAGLRSLKFLLTQSNIKIFCIVSSQKGLSAKAFEKIAYKNSIPITTKLDLKKRLKNLKYSNFKIDFVLSVFSPFIVEEEILNSTTFGGFNLHPGKLPEYSGMNPTSWAIYNNEKYHEITLHKMNNIIDAGDIVLSKKFIINKDETALSLIAKSTIKGVDLLKEFIYMISKQSIKDIKLIKQDLNKRNYYSDFTPIANLLDWNNSIEKIDRIFRSSFLGPLDSHLGFPIALVNQKTVRLKNYKIIKRKHSNPIGEINFISKNEIQVACKDGFLRATILD